MADPTVEGLVRGGAVAARLYVLAALDEAEVAIQHQVTLAFRAAREKYAGDLRGDEPWKLLIAMEQHALANPTEHLPAPSGAERTTP